MKNSRMLTGVCVAILLSLVTSGLALADGGKMYQVTITNLTQKQVITPPLLISHKRGFEVFRIGQAASDELVALAEGGDTQPLAAVLGTRDDVLDLAVAGGPILPGTSTTMQVRTRGKFNRLSVVGMLATTNDAFFALQGVRGRSDRQIALTAVAYDAGSEANTEQCAHIPGPPCGSQVRMTTGAEGFIHVHNGIHGIGDLNRAAMDWRNPVVRVTIEKVNR
ncbi:hypothetical protein C2E25_12180 [Geothermobacter hydrogeniphilus]|uniref:Uncharacterized protein n=1 Tax=Geothermobacter hydrogeniphilus TaxID=1969733 RepID=A0A2K2H8D6_9BACT|nr:spondin domain-containing protein [Geothermobacter hydrogeniphilus]PNU19493.1 hypothetical protein C2E25_12180 [Geothermobacter hydrogeniphilus]